MRQINVIVGVTIAIIAVGAILAPVITDVVARSDDFFNDGLYYVDRVPSGDSMHYVYDGNAVYLNDVMLISNDHPIDYDSSTALIFTEHITINWRNNENVMRIRGVVNANVKNFDLIVTDSAITGTYTQTDDTERTANWAYSEFHGIVKKSNWVMSNTPIIVKGDSEIYTTRLIDVNNFGSRFYILHIIGSINNGFTVSIYSQNSGSIVDDINVVYTLDYHPVNGYLDLYRLDSINFDFSRVVDDTVETGNYQISVLTCPVKIVADREKPLLLSAAAIAIAIVPIILVSLLVFVIKGFRDY